MKRVDSKGGSDSQASSRPSTASDTQLRGNKGDGETANMESKSARIALRKSRIDASRQARLKPVVQGDIKKRKQKSIILQVSPSEQQIQESRKHLENNKLSGFEAVTNIRVASEARESMRRMEEKKKSELWVVKRAEDAEFEANQTNVINEKWKKSNQYHYPHALRDMLVSIKADCDKLIDNKNRLIAEYMADLKLKDDEYVKELKRQSEEIDSMLMRMKSQYKGYQEVMMIELEQIEKAFMTERSELLECQAKEVMSLQEERRQKEAKFLEDKAKRIEEAMKSLEELRVHDAEDYNVVKIKLETDVQVLEQQLQQMKATYQLNAEKLEYNYQVLKKRDDENMIVINQQKRRITKSTDVLNNLKSRLTKQEKNHQLEYQNLTEELKGISEQVKQLQKKFKHFQTADQKKFQEIWTMNEEEVKVLMRKVLQVHEQQLGIQWLPPLEDLHYFSLHGKNNGLPELDGNVDAVTSIVNGNQQGPASNLPPLDFPIIRDGTNGVINSKDISNIKFDHFSEPVKMIIELLCNEAGFLIEDKLNRLLLPLQKEEQSLMKLDAIFKALGIEDLNDIDRLARYFVNPQIKNDDGTSVLIEPHEVVKVLKKYLEDSRHLKSKGEQSRLKSTAVEVFQNTLNGDLQESLKTQTQYWQRMSNILSDENYSIWNSVCDELDKSHHLLTDRWRLHKEINDIKKQNEEMKLLLRQYLTAKVNDELEIPPTKVLLGQ